LETRVVTIGEGNGDLQQRTGKKNRKKTKQSRKGKLLICLGNERSWTTRQNQRVWPDAISPARLKRHPAVESGKTPTADAKRGKRKKRNWYQVSEGRQRPNITVASTGGRRTKDGSNEKKTTEFDVQIGTSCRNLQSRDCRTTWREREERSKKRCPSENFKQGNTASLLTNGRGVQGGDAVSEEPSETRKKGEATIGQ